MPLQTDPITRRVGQNTAWFLERFRPGPLVVNLGIGMITPPVGNCLYVACGMSKRLSFEQISKACIPYIVMLMIALLLITYVEPISMGLIWLTGASAI